MNPFHRRRLYWVFVVWVAGGAAKAAEEPVQLVLTPNEVALGAGESAQAVLLVKAGTAALADIELHPTDMAGLQVRPSAGGEEGWKVGCIEAGSSRSIELTLQRDAKGAGGTGVVPLRLTYRPLSGSACVGAEATERGGSARSDHVVGLTVSDSGAPKMSGLAEIEVKSGIQLIEDRRHGGLAYVVVTNSTSHPLQITGVRCFAPYFLTVSGGGDKRPEAGFWIVRAFLAWWGNEEGQAETATSDCGTGLRLPKTLEAGSSRALPFQITAEVVEPGQHTVAWEVDLQWLRGDIMQQGSMVADKTFNVGVLGESTILQLFAWPSILVLPGALMLQTFLTLRKRVWPGKESDIKAAETSTKAEFWLYAVPLSLLTGILYPWLTGKLGDPRDFMVVHGLDDIVNLWFGSMFAAVIAWALFYGGQEISKRTYLEIRNWQERRNFPQPSDKPLKVLDKLRRTDRPDLMAEFAEVTHGGSTLRGLVIVDTGAAGVWVAPPIVVGCRDTAEAERLNALRENADLLPDAIRRGQQKGAVVSVKWKAKAGTPTHPFKLPQEAELKRQGNRVRLVEVEVVEE